MSIRRPTPRSLRSNIVTVKAQVAVVSPVAGEKAALAGTAGTPSGANRYVTNSDPRNANARSPTVHAATHEDGGSDEISTATPGANAIPKAGGGGALALGWIPNLSEIYQLLSMRDAANGYGGLNPVQRITKGTDASDDLIVNVATKGLVLKDTQSPPHYWRVSISTLGVLQTADLGTSLP